MHVVRRLMNLPVSLWTHHVSAVAPMLQPDFSLPIHKLYGCPTHIQTIYQLIHIYAHVSIHNTWFHTHFDVFLVQLHILVHGMQNLYVKPLELEEDGSNEDGLWIQSDGETWRKNGLLTRKTIKIEKREKQFIYHTLHFSSELPLGFWYLNQHVTWANNKYINSIIDLEYIFNKCRHGMVLISWGSPAFVVVSVNAVEP